MTGELDLTDVPTPTLQRALELLSAGRLSAPLSIFELSANGLGALSGQAAALTGFSAEAVRALLTAVLAERGRGGLAEPELVWTGPETKVSGARDTAIVLRELFSGARKSVLVAGFRFDHGKTLLKPLHAGMREHRLSCSIFADREEAQAFIGREWPFGPPFPEVFFDARGEQYSSVHAKCVVVDGSQVFVTSANFTDRGQRRNVEVGVLLENPHLAQRLQQQFLSLVRSGSFMQLKRVGS